MSHFNRLDAAAGEGLNIQAGGSPSDANTVNRIVVTKTGIANNTATAIANLVVPASFSGAAGGTIRILGALGASGSVGPYEAGQFIEYGFAVTRAGSGTAVAGLSTAYGSASGTFSGGTAPVVTATVSAASGSATAIQYLALNVNIVATTAGANNHVAMAEVSLSNLVASGITVQQA